MNYKFSNLLGAPYRGGNLLFHGNALLSPVGNRVSEVDLVEATSSTLPFENLKQVQKLAVSPDGTLLLSIDTDGRALVVNRRRRALLHHFSFKSPVAAARFSPDGKYVACAVGRLLQVWLAPELRKSMAPMRLHRTYGHCHGDVSALDWSADSRWIAVASRDLTARVFSLDPIEGYKPATLAGHRDALVGVFFAGRRVSTAAEVDGKDVPELYTVSRDGAVLAWTYDRPAGHDADDPQPREMYAGGSWRLSERHFFNARGSRVTSAAFHQGTALLLVGLTNGIFALYQLPEFQELQALSVSREAVTAVVWGPKGDWLGVGCAALGQLLVWEWRSETYVLKQQGHYFDVAAVAYSPDGAHIATGADDSKVKVWSAATGFCFVTFSEHRAPVTAVAFLPSGSAVLSAGMDGTVRAWDLVRYRNFRTFTSPDRVQFVSLAVDPSGEIVCAGSLDTFQIFVWSVRTGRLLDVLAAHEGPVAALAFSPSQPLLASASWDRSVRLWDVFSGKGGVELLQHSHDVLALAWRPDGRLLASSTLDGQIWLWDPLQAEVQGTIEGRRDIARGRLASDRRAAGNAGSGQAFRALACSADGEFLLAGGGSKWVCMYDVAERVLLRRFQVSANRSLDGVLDTLNSKNMTDAGPLELLDDEDSGAEEGDALVPTAGGIEGAEDLPGTGGRGKKRAVAQTRGVALSPTGRSFAAATTEGLLLYSLDQGAVFDPTDLAEDVTPEAARAAARRGALLRALLLALRLRDASLVSEVLMATPPDQVTAVAAGVPTASVPAVLQVVSEQLARSPHLEFCLRWVQALCHAHGRSLQDAPRSGVMPALRSLQKGLARLHEDLAGMCESNIYSLRYICAAGAAADAEDGGHSSDTLMESLD